MWGFLHLAELAERSQAATGAPLAARLQTRKYLATLPPSSRFRTFLNSETRQPGADSPVPAQPQRCCCGPPAALRKLSALPTWYHEALHYFNLFRGLIKCREQVFAHNYFTRAAHGHGGGTKAVVSPRFPAALREEGHTAPPQRKLLLPQLPSQQLAPNIKGAANEEKQTLPYCLAGGGLPAPPGLKARRQQEKSRPGGWLRGEVGPWEKPLGPAASFLPWLLAAPQRAVGAVGGGRVTFQHLAGSLGVGEEGFPRRRQVRDAEAGSRHRAAADPAGGGGGGGGGHLGPAQPARGEEEQSRVRKFDF